MACPRSRVPHLAPVVVVHDDACIAFLLAHTHTEKKLEEEVKELEVKLAGQKQRLMRLAEELRGWVMTKTEVRRVEKRGRGRRGGRKKRPKSERRLLPLSPRCLVRQRIHVPRPLSHIFFIKENLDIISSGPLHLAVLRPGVHAPVHGGIWKNSIQSPREGGAVHTLVRCLSRPRIIWNFGVLGDDIWRAADHCNSPVAWTRWSMPPISRACRSSTFLS